MAIPIALAVGEHLLYADPAIEWAVRFSDTRPPSVVLTASMQAGPKPPLFSPPAGATSVAIQMDAQVGMGLYEKLGELGRSMGWLRHAGYACHWSGERGVS